MQLPADFTSNMRLLLGDEGFGAFASALDDEPPVSIRLNPLKVPMLGDEYAERLRRRLGDEVPWCEGGYYLPRRPQFTFDPLLHAGVYYVQEASSMFLDWLLRRLLPELSEKKKGEPLSMLDLCAAPGGKSTVARAALPEGSLLVSNEPMRTRAQILSENMLKWGHPDVVVTNNYPNDYRRAGMRFDIVLCDVPCSGEGMFRKDSQAVAEWSRQNVEQCWRLQRQIVADAWECLADGGLLIYSTCTFNTEENEQNIGWCEQELGAEVVGVDVDASWGITSSLLPGFCQPVYRFLPGRTRGEGLFMAVMRKPAGDASADSCDAIRRKVRKRLRVLSDGPKPPQKKGKDLLPDVSEALQASGKTAADKSAGSVWPRCELTWEQAVAYLRKETLVLPPDVPRGIVMVTFWNVALGFVKNVANRANNLYPQEWTIKSTHIPNNYDETIS